MTSLRDLLEHPQAMSEPAYEAVIEAHRLGRTVEQLKGARDDVEAFGGYFDHSDERDAVDVVNGVALIPVRGYLTPHPYWRGDRASYDWIASALEWSLQSPAVAEIVFCVDSGGGAVAGCDELCTQIFEARGQKPMQSVVESRGCSAAYWIASSAPRVLCGRTSLVGSIGVIMTFLDWSKFDEQLGIQEINIVSSQSPDKDIDPTTEHGRSRVQATVDQLAGVFVEDVARNRGVSAETVISDFGQGWVLVGAGAAESGLADDIGTLEGVLETGEGTMQTVAISNITPEWIAQNLPDVAKALTDAGSAEAQEAAESLTEDARAEGHREGEEAERARVLEVFDAALPEDSRSEAGTFLRDLIADGSIDRGVAAERILARERASGADALDALRRTEPDTPPSASGEDDEATAQAARIKAAGDAAEKQGALRG